MPTDETTIIRAKEKIMRHFHLDEPHGYRAIIKLCHHTRQTKIAVANNILRATDRDLEWMLRHLMESIRAWVPSQESLQRAKEAGYATEAGLRQEDVAHPE